MLFPFATSQAFADLMPDADKLIVIDSGIVFVTSKVSDHDSSETEGIVTIIKSVPEDRLVLAGQFPLRNQH